MTFAPPTPDKDGFCPTCGQPFTIAPSQDALSAERARVIEECARVAGEKSAMLPHQNDFVRGYANGRADAAAALAATRFKSVGTGGEKDVAVGGRAGAVVVEDRVAVNEEVDVVVEVFTKGPHDIGG